ncbi:hypothetical protein D7Y15_16680 [Corallococcus sp. AB030]|nr:hypothetical protein D7Y15_16680 [Corallococcus sp. AB030]RUO92880.1 hypothetical protein D7Y11_12695 [Corallococcus sp. AB018]
MNDEPEERLTCPRCGGSFGDSTRERGIVFTPCLRCDQAMAAACCAPIPGTASGWRVQIPWRGPELTLKEAASLRQILPVHANESIQCVRDQYRGLPGWTGRRLSHPEMLELRAAAEACGFKVIVEEEDKHVPRLHLPPHPATFHGVEFSPSFFEKGALATIFREPHGTLVIASESLPLPECVPIPQERGRQFLDEVASLAPLEMTDSDVIGMDGISLYFRLRHSSEERGFVAWSPDAHRAPRHHALVLALFRLATELAREAGSITFLEGIHGYLEAGLPVKVFEETPRRVRLFGRLSSLSSETLDSLFAATPPETPLLMDLTGFEGMGTLLYPRFARFHQRPGGTVWWVNRIAARQLKEAGIPEASLYTDLELARAALAARPT